MPNGPSAWKYCGSVPSGRQTVLATPGSFEDLVALAVTDITGVRARIEPGRDRGLEHCLQPVFSFDLPNTETGSSMVSTVIGPNTGTARLKALQQTRR